MKLDQDKLFEVFSLIAHRTDIPPIELVRRAKTITAELGYYAPEVLAQAEENSPKALEEFTNFLNELTVRTANCLRAEGIHTLPHLLRLTPRTVLKIPNMGKKSLLELRHTLAARNLYLRGDEP